LNTPDLLKDGSDALLSIQLLRTIRSNQKKSFIQEEIGLEHVKEESAGPEVFSTLSEEELIKLISALPEGYKMVFNLFAIEGYTHKEIGELLNIEESTSRSQLMKARRMLQEKVNELYTIAV
jgi:RNA polymerase sigma factor (sigma-70 family)